MAPYDGQRGSGLGSGLGSRLGRIFSDGDNPLSWAIPLFRVWGIQVSMHLLFVVWMVFQTIRELGSEQPRLGEHFLFLGVIFGIVLIHEFGHCIACRRVGGRADKILLWPLGGLASCQPPHNWRAELITVIGGPIVHVFLWPIFAAGVYFAGVGTLLPNLLSPWSSLVPGLALWKITIFYAYIVNIYLFLFNMLLVMYPMDAGRVLQCLLWRSLGECRSREITSTVGLVAAGIVGLYALSVDGSGRMLLGIAIFGAIFCWQEKQQLKMAAQYGSQYGGEFNPAGGWSPSGPGEGHGLYNFSNGQSEDEDVNLHTQSRAERRRKRAADKAQKKQQDAADAQRVELDRLLVKIKEDGMDALSRKEKAFLERDTQRRRGA